MSTRLAIGGACPGPRRRRRIHPQEPHNPRRNTPQPPAQHTTTPGSTHHNPRLNTPQPPAQQRAGAVDGSDDVVEPADGGAVAGVAERLESLVPGLAEQLVDLDE